ncbi:hypothetical protein Srot_0032 [Segniliparus rotundus DSM 44985]|uniref:PD-(D/E)XK endonuclease-like domain-containing protein n=1 Tax=Segniliparus rotundus (strain ATCC BAA-972 / CDC 1076 / CIP 108378 / DSM 44985 / JCM 13578) TaxID=640132 RepID=D6Z9J8_SEGRD|nr:hypothetical protein [Segniliparus rotundus]ADG96525.1 hypothetical protein Srot_0032 [Segniliparus rotundus DSM 44985]
MSGLVRIEKGRNHFYELDGERVDGVTTILSGGIPKAALMPWALKTAAQFAVENWDELCGLGQFERVDQIKKAPWRERDEAANRGSEVHRLAERLMRGEEVTVPATLSGHVRSCVDFLDEWQPVPVLLECPVASRAERYAGTLDAVVDIPGEGRCLIDFKTSRSGVHPETGLQLAAYRHADFALAGGEEVAMGGLGVERAFGVWLRPDGYSVHELRAGAEEFAVFLSAARIARWAKTSKQVVGEALERQKH